MTDTPIHPEIEQLIRDMFDAEGRDLFTHDRVELIAAVRHLLVAVDIFREEETKLRKEHRDAYLIVMEERDSARNQLRALQTECGQLRARIAGIETAYEAEREAWLEGGG